MRLLAAKTEFKTIASKIIQHPADTIEKIKLRRRVIELSVQTRLSGAAVPSRSGDSRSHGYAWPAGVRERRAKPHDCGDDRILRSIGNVIPALT